MARLNATDLEAINMNRGDGASHGPGVEPMRTHGKKYRAAGRHVEPRQAVRGAGGV